MTLRIIDAEVQLDQAFGLLRSTLKAWAGGRDEAWQQEGRDGVRAEGAAYSRREDVYVAVERDERRWTLSVALTEKDQILLEVAIPRRDPARDRKRFAMAWSDGDEPFLLLGVDELRRQGLRDPFRRLAGAPLVKRANVSDRDYVLIGPLKEEGAPDALLSLAALHPRFEALVERLGALAGRSDEADEAEIYTVSPRVARERRVHAKVSAALFQRLRGAGFQIAELKSGVLRADFAAVRGDKALAFEIRADAEIGGGLKALGQLVAVAPAGGAGSGPGFRRSLVLPGPRESLGSALAPFEAAFRELGVLVLLYDFKDGEVFFWAQAVPPDFPNDLRALFD